jgi:hypothetical protein
MRPQFDHEKLKIYQSAIRFITWSDPEMIQAGKQELFEIVSMLIGLANSLNARIQEDTPNYGVEKKE